MGTPRKAKFEKLMSERGKSHRPGVAEWVDGLETKTQKEVLDFMDTYMKSRRAGRAACSWKKLAAFFSDEYDFPFGGDALQRYIEIIHV